MSRTQVFVQIKKFQDGRYYNEGSNQPETSVISPNVGKVIEMVRNNW